MQNFLDRVQRSLCRFAFMEQLNRTLLSAAIFCAFAAFFLPLKIALLLAVLAAGLLRWRTRRAAPNAATFLDTRGNLQNLAATAAAHQQPFNAHSVWRDVFAAHFHERQAKLAKIPLPRAPQHLRYWLLPLALLVVNFLLNAAKTDLPEKTKNALAENKNLPEQLRISPLGKNGENSENESGINALTDETSPNNSNTVYNDLNPENGGGVGEGLTNLNIATTTPNIIAPATVNFVGKDFLLTPQTIWKQLTPPEYVPPHYREAVQTYLNALHD